MKPRRSLLSFETYSILVSLSGETAGVGCEGVATIEFACDGNGPRIRGVAMPVLRTSLRLAAFFQCRSAEGYSNKGRKRRLASFALQGPEEAFLRTRKRSAVPRIEAWCR
jgi:hypothetical protein